MSEQFKIYDKNLHALVCDENGSIKPIIQF